MAELEPVRLSKNKKLPWLNVLLFLGTVVATFFAGLGWAAPFWPDMNPPWYAGWIFAVPLLSILLFHEFGHYIAARIHRVEASLPYFIPFPFVFGTLGAIIRMRGRIAQRNALLDIGASGPLAGMAVSLPVLIYGMSLSQVGPQSPGEYLLEGHSLLYKLLLFLTHGPIPTGHDIQLHPVALAGWVGLFVTMLNLIPVGQLDGGHVAYALFGDKHNRVSDVVLTTLPFLSLAVCGYYGIQGYLTGYRGLRLLEEAMVGLNWLVWFGVLHLMRRYAGKKHPPVDPGELSTPRMLIAITCLVLFVLIFMPVPLRAVIIE